MTTYTAHSTGRPIRTRLPWGTVHRIVTRYAESADWTFVLQGTGVPKPSAKRMLRDLGLTRSVAESKRLAASERDGVDYEAMRRRALALRIDGDHTTTEIRRRLAHEFGHTPQPQTLAAWLGEAGVQDRWGSWSHRRRVARARREAWERAHAGRSEPEECGGDEDGRLTDFETEAVLKGARVVGARYGIAWEELVGPAYDEVLRRRPKFRSARGGYQQYVGHAAWAGAMGHVRREAKRREATGTDGTRALVERAEVGAWDRDDHGEDVELSAEEQEMRERVRRAMQALRGDDRRAYDVVRRVVIEGHPARAVAQSLDLTEARISQIRSAALYSLRTRLTESIPTQSAAEGGIYDVVS